MRLLPRFDHYQDAETMRPSAYPRSHKSGHAANGSTIENITDGIGTSGSGMQEKGCATEEEGGYKE